jgi:hypothetical protein
MELFTIEDSENPFKEQEIFLTKHPFIMKTTSSLILVAFLIVSGCSKSNDLSSVNPNENQFESARTISIAPSIFGVADNTSLLQTTVYAPPPTSTYNYSLFPGYDFTKYDPDNVYDAIDYDLMTHFVYISPEDVKGAVIEFTFSHIKYFVPHITGPKQLRIYTVNDEDDQSGNDEDHQKGDKADHKRGNKEDHQSGNNEDHQTGENEDDQMVIKCTTDLVAGLNPMFCFIVKVECSNENKGYTTIWTDMKVNGVSVKGTIKNKVFACN